MVVHSPETCPEKRLRRQHPKGDKASLRGSITSDPEKQVRHPCAIPHQILHHSTYMLAVSNSDNMNTLVEYSAK